MAKRFICFLLFQSFVCKVLSIYAQPAIQQYLQLTGAPTRTITLPAPQHGSTAQNVAVTNQPRPTTGLPALSAIALPNLVSSLQQLPQIQQTTPCTNPGVTNQARHTSGMSSLSTVDLPILVSALQQLQKIQTPTPQPASQPRPATGIPSFSALALPNLVSNLPLKPTAIEPAKSSSIDSKLLNNLAVALQLLIVSNILNAPNPDSVKKPVNDVGSCSEPDANPYYSQTLPNSNFVGASSFSEPNLANAYNPTRNSMSLMSPYEALGSNSAYAESSFSQSSKSMNPRSGFQSPYSMLAEKDLFSMNDLF